MIMAMMLLYKNPSFIWNNRTQNLRKMATKSDQ